MNTEEEEETEIEEEEPEEKKDVNEGIGFLDFQKMDLQLGLSPISFDDVFDRKLLI